MCLSTYFIVMFYDKTAEYFIKFGMGAVWI
jgi:hypothetical protein